MKIISSISFVFSLAAIFLFITANYTTAQPRHKIGTTVIKPKVKSYKDSIKLETMVDAGKDAIARVHNVNTYADVVKFTLKITNESTVPLPDPVAYKGSKFVKLYINGHLNMPKAIFDENEAIADTDKVIGTGQSQSFYCGWLRSSRTKLVKKYGSKFTVQFAYLNVLSPKVNVDLNAL